MKIDKTKKKVKTYTNVEIKSIDKENFTAKIIISTGEVDRDREIVEPSAFKKRLKEFKKHNVLLSSHSYNSLRNQIGEVPKIKVEDNQVTATVKYYVDEGNPEADWGWNLVSKGIAAYSIGFMVFEYERIEEKESEKTGAYFRYIDIELLELSQVLVPSNRGGLQERAAKDEADKELCLMAMKSFSDEELKEFEPEGSYTVPLEGGFHVPPEWQDDFDKALKEVNTKEVNKAIYNMVIKIIADKMNEGFKKLSEKLIEKNGDLKEEIESIESKIDERLKEIESKLREEIKTTIQNNNDKNLFKTIMLGNVGEISKTDQEDKGFDVNKIVGLIKEVQKNNGGN